MTRSANCMLAVIVGAVYVVAGGLGFAVTSDAGFFSTKGGLLLGVFEVNPMHNIVNILVGFALVTAGLVSAHACRTFNAVIGTMFLLLGITGLFVAGSEFNIFAINGWDNAAHFATAIVLLTAGLGADNNLAKRQSRAQQPPAT